MRFTQRLYAQHLGWTFKKHWQVQGKRIPKDTGASSGLEKLAILVKEPMDVLNSPMENNRFEIVNSAHYIADSSHPQWNDRKCYIYGDSNILLEGMSQAQQLTKTIKFSGMPKHLQELLANMSLPNIVHRNVQQTILASNIYDAEQVMLSKNKNPDRPAYNFPRQYGISQQRRNQLLINKLLMECEKFANSTVTSRRRLIGQADFSVTLPKDGDLIQLNVRIDKMVTSSSSIESVKGKFDADLPDLYPIKSTISLPKRNIYTTETYFPLSTRLKCSKLHTIFSFFNKEQVGNVHGLEVSKTQYQSRTLLNAFVAAAARAKQLYGESCLNNIPKPIVVQSIQTDGRSFHFGVFQLNTLKLGKNDNLKNYWFNEEIMDLYAQCGYKCGQPYLYGYDKNVFRYINAFYHND